MGYVSDRRGEVKSQITGKAFFDFFFKILFFDKIGNFPVICDLEGFLFEFLGKCNTKCKKKCNTGHKIIYLQYKYGIMSHVTLGQSQRKLEMANFAKLFHCQWI